MPKKKHKPSKRHTASPAALPTAASLPSPGDLLDEAQAVFLKVKDSYFGKIRGLDELSKAFTIVGFPEKADAAKDIVNRLQAAADDDDFSDELYDPRRFDEDVAACRKAMQAVGPDSDRDDALFAAVDEALRKYTDAFDKWGVEAEIDDFGVREMEDVQIILIQNENLLEEAIVWNAAQNRIDAARRIIDYFEEDMRYLHYDVLTGALAKQGYIDEALRFAREISVDGAGAEFRCDALAAIARECALLGKEEKFKAVMDELYGLRGTVHSFYWNYSTPDSRAFSTLCELGRIEEAEALKKEVGDDISDMLVAMDLPPALAAVGRETEAQAFLWKFLGKEFDSILLTSVLTKIAENTAKKKGLDAAAPIYSDLLLSVRRNCKHEPFYLGMGLIQTAKSLHAVREAPAPS